MSLSDGGIVTPLNSWAAAGVARRAAAAASVARLRQALTIISSDVAVRRCPCSGRRGPNLKRSTGGGAPPWNLEDSCCSGRLSPDPLPTRGVRPVGAPCVQTSSECPSWELYRFFAGGPFWATAAFTSALNAPASTFSPSWMSIALRVLPSKLELKRRDGSGILAPRANVSFTTFVYASPVQTIPWCDQTGVPIHFHSSVISGSASRISARMRARVSPRHPPRSRLRWSMSIPAFASACAGDLDLLAALRGALARDVTLAFGFGFALAGLRTELVGAFMMAI